MKSHLVEELLINLYYYYYYYYYLALANRTRKSIQVFNLLQTWVSTYMDLHPLVMTYVLTSTHVFHRLATQHKSTQVDGKSTVYA